MASFTVQVADAVVAVLNSETSQTGFSKNFRAIRYYLPVFDQKDLQSLRVTVVPSRYTPTNQTRGATTQKDCVIDIGVQQVISQGKIEPGEINDVCDELMSLAEEIGDCFRGKSLSGMATTVCTSSENVVIYDPAHIDQHRVFTTVVSLTFRKVA